MIVCDGFVGNVIMKLMEGCAVLFSNMMKQEFMKKLKYQLGAALAKPALRNFKKQMDYTEDGGALLLGVNGGVIKAHGSSNAKAIKNAIRQARTFAQQRTVEIIKEKLAALSK